jgi:hypothetical protein
MGSPPTESPAYIKTNMVTEQLTEEQRQDLCAISGAL